MKLTRESRALQIVLMRDAGHPRREIAEHVGCSVPTVDRVLREHGAVHSRLDARGPDERANAILLELSLSGIRDAPMLAHTCDIPLATVRADLASLEAAGRVERHPESPGRRVWWRIPTGGQP